MSTLPLLLLVFVIGIFFSCAETAFTSFDRILLVNWLRSNRYGSRLVHFLTERPDRFLGTSLIGNNLANVAYSSLIVLWAEEVGINSLWLVTISPLIVLVFSEILPKMIGYALSNRLVRVASFPMLVAYVVLYPVRLILLPLMQLVSRNGARHEGFLKAEPLIVRRELDQILVGAEAEGAVTHEEGELLTRYLDARDLKVRQIMTPRTRLVAVSIEQPPDEVRAVFRDSGLNILPVYRDNLDHIIGYVRALDFLIEHSTVSEVMRPLLAVPESKRIVDLLQEFRLGRHQAALVVDEYGGTDGVVTMKDVFEELVGPVAERFDSDRPVVRKLSPGRFLVSGVAMLDEIETATGWEAPEGDYNTLAGLIAARLGRIAEAGEEIDIEGVTVRVVKRTPRRVEGCLLKFVELRDSKDREST